MWTEDSGEREKGRLWCARRWLGSEAPKSRTGNDRVYGGQTNQAIGNSIAATIVCLSQLIFDASRAAEGTHTHTLVLWWPPWASKCRSGLLCAPHWHFCKVISFECVLLLLSSGSVFDSLWPQWQQYRQEMFMATLPLPQRHDDVLLCITFYLFMIASQASSTCPMPVMTRRDYMKLDKKSNCTAIQLLLQLLSIFKRHLLPHWRIRMKQET